MFKKMKNEKIYLTITITSLILITLFTNFFGNTDVFDYSDVSKFFANDYNAKIRTSHSYLYGLIHSPFFMLFESFIIFKITSLISLFLIIYSTYHLTNKNKKSLWLMLLSPIVWYMAPWISPIQLSSLIFLWGWHFVKKYNSEENKNQFKPLIYSGLLVGLSWAFWDGILFFIPLLAISYLYDKKLTHIIYFTILVLIGALPKLILDQYLFGFALFGTIRHIMASLALTFLGGFYDQGNLSGKLDFILMLFFLPLFTYLTFTKKVIMKNKKEFFFITLSIILLAINSQIRFVILIVPIILITISKFLTNKKVLIQIVFSLIIILLVINPYLIQTKNHLSFGDPFLGAEIGAVITKPNEIEIIDNFPQEYFLEDLNKLLKNYPNQSFIIGNRPDSYRMLANIYSGDEVLEFVSIEDYKLSQKENQAIAEKTLCTQTKINSRRDFCLSISNVKAFNDKTDYTSINYALSEDNHLDLENFEFVENYGSLSLFKKVSN